MSQLMFEDFLAEENFYSVVELTRDIKQVLESTYSSIWVQGEISNFTHHVSGHMYFSLKDEQAQISCVMWQSRNQGLYFTPQDGMKVTINGRLSVFEKRGTYQLAVWQLLPAGRGDLQVAFERLKSRLKEEGLFAEEHKQEIPEFPERVGLITSETGAAVRDLVTVLRRRFPSIQIILSPVRVQGGDAAAEIADAVRAFNDFGEVDVIIVGRGGGSMENLWAFNEESVARAVFESQIPVISAVGHEVDFTICDFVSDLRAPTPSAAAELAVRNRAELKEIIRQQAARMTATICDTVVGYRERILAIEKSYAFRQPLDLIQQFQQRSDENRRILDNLIGHRTELCREMVSGLERRLSLLEHGNVLKRGYSICTRVGDGNIVRSAEQLQQHDDIRIRFGRGEALSKVYEVSP